jgi:lysophospholipase L1-like esterase
MRPWLPLLSTVFVALSGCGEVPANGQSARILALGDSLMASHSISGRSISDTVEKSLGEPVINRSVLGARIIYKLPISGAAGLSIPKQYLDGDWDWVVVNGGGNDLWLGCGCGPCDRKMNKLISRDGSKGAIPSMVSRLRSSGSKVIYVGYLRSPGVGSPIEHCRDDGNELESRVARLAERDEGTYFLSLADLVPHGDRSFHGIDMIHPSLKASNAIGQRVARIIAENSSQ